MSLDKEIIQKAHSLRDIIHDNSAQYFHTLPLAISESGLILPNKTKHTFYTEYDIKDLLTIGAITQSPILLTGGTDLGKTTLARLVMNALFGKEEEGWHKIDLDTDFGKDAYANVDFSAITEGKTLTELYKASSFLFLPGLILDEINRLHAKLGNKLLHFFDKDITLPDGSRVKLGKQLGNGNTYQFQIAAVNEGGEYQGTFDMDKALRRRIVIEIPLDIFTPTPYDRLCIQKQGQKETELRNKTSNLETVLEIYKKTGSLQLHPTAEMFISYLEAFDYCKHSLTENKGGVDSKNGSVRHICAKPIEIGGQPSPTEMGCEFLRTFENELCPYVRGITPGVSKNLIAVAKGFALLRATKFVEMIAGHLAGKERSQLSYAIKNPEKFTESLQKYAGTDLTGKGLARAAVEKYFNSLEVERCDIEAAIGFVGYSKVGIAGPWIIKHYQGNRYEAVKSFSRQAREKFEEGLLKPEVWLIGEHKSNWKDAIKNIPGSDKERVMSELESYCKNENPWLWRVITPYLKDEETLGKDEAQKLYE